MKENIVRVLLGLAIVILLVLVIVLASIYGTRLNCYKTDEENKNYKHAKIPTMTHFPKIMDTALTPIASKNGAKAHMKTIAFSQVPGKEMRATVLRVDPGPALKFTHTSESIVVVISNNKITVEDSATQTFQATKGDSFYVSRGTKVSYKATTRCFLYIVTQPALLKYSVQLQETMNNAGASKIERALNFDVAKPNIPLFENKYKSLSYLNDTLLSKVKDAELSGGLYLLKAGPALLYKYEYEEFKYIHSGEFHLKDTAGKYVVAKGGDLMYFPKDVDVHFTSPNEALGFYVGQRSGGSA